MTDDTTGDETETVPTPGDAAEDYSDILAAVKGDPNRELASKETAFSFNRVDDRMTVTSASPTSIRYLLQHDDFQLKWYEASAGGRSYERIDAADYAADGHDGRRPVYAVHGTLPRGVLKVKAEARVNPEESPMYSNAIREDGDGD
jgi:hypothetical protein